MSGKLSMGIMLLLTALPFSACGLGPSVSSSERSGFDAAEDRRPTGKTLYAMAAILIDQRRYEAAETTLKQVVQLEPRFTPAYSTLALVELHLSRPAEAAAVLKQGIAIEPRNPILLNNAGMCCIMQKDYLTAQAFFQRAVEADGRTPRYRANLAMSLAMNRHYDEALRAYLKAVSPADAHHNLAVICMHQGDTSRAKQELAAERLCKAAPPAVAPAALAQTPPQPAAQAAAAPSP